MEKEILEELIIKHLSIREIAKLEKTSYSNVRYYLKKFGLKTLTKYKRSLKYNTNTSKYNTNISSLCLECSLGTEEYKRFCSAKCKNRFYARNGMKDRRRKAKIKLLNILGGKCFRCGYNKNYAGLDFHHNDPKQKEFVLSATYIAGHKWENALKEVQKCIILCANCHREEHNKDQMAE